MVLLKSSLPRRLFVYNLGVAQLSLPHIEPDLDKDLGGFGWMMFNVLRKTPAWKIVDLKAGEGTIVTMEKMRVLFVVQY